jgi:DNA-binding MarR family transcriptional regulator
MTTTDPAEGEVGLPFLLRTAQRTYGQAVTEALTEVGFDDIPRNAAFVLSGIRKGTPAGPLLAQLGVSKQAASKLVDTLALRGYLVREEDPADRRRLTLTLTDRGEAAAMAIRVGADDVDRRLDERLDAADRATLRAALRVLADLGTAAPAIPKATSKAHAEAAPQQPRPRSFSPVFPVRDLDAALAHYTALGFTTEAYHDGGYGFADRGQVSLHLSVLPEHEPDGNVCAAYLHVDDADALAAEWARPGIGGRTVPPTDTPYRMREGAHLDPDNNLIRFGSPLRKA